MAGGCATAGTGQQHVIGAQGPNGGSEKLVPDREFFRYFSDLFLVPERF